MENSTLVSDLELNDYINESITEWRDLIIEHQGPEIFLTSATVTTASGTVSYALPATFYELIKVVVNLGGPDKTQLEPYGIDDHDIATSGSGWSWSSSVPRYRIIGDLIYFAPIPNAVRTVTLWFVPTFARLSADADTLDGFNGWEEWVVLDAAIKCLNKEESDASYFIAQREKVEQRIARHAARRDASGPTKMRDVSARRSSWED